MLVNKIYPLLALSHSFLLAPLALPEETTRFSEISAIFSLAPLSDA